MAKITTMDNRKADIIYYTEYEIDGKKWNLPYCWAEQGEGFRNFVRRSDDVYVMGLPRSGTTLTQELVWLLENNLDFETAKKLHVCDRSPYYEISLFPKMWRKCGFVRPSPEVPEVLESVPVDTSKYSYEVYADLPSPRVFKTHLALSVLKGILDTGCKVIYLLRNPKDVMVSQARFVCCGNISLANGNPQAYISGRIDKQFEGGFTPYWQHIKEAWTQRHHKNLLIMHYEEYRTDLLAAIKKIAAFLGKEYSNEKLAELVVHLDIENFRKNPMVNSVPGLEQQVTTFIGNGRVGGWGEVLTPEQENCFDRWIEENTDGTDIADLYLKKKTTKIET